MEGVTNVEVAYNIEESVSVVFLGNGENIGNLGTVALSPRTYKTS